jgi:hypothetical protein
MSRLVSANEGVKRVYGSIAEKGFGTEGGLSLLTLLARDTGQEGKCGILLETDDHPP